MGFTLVDHGEFSFADGGTANSSTGHDVVLPGAANPQAGDFDVLFVGSDTTITTPVGGTLFDLYSTFVNNQGGYAFVRRCGAATISKDTTGSTAITTNATSATVDITAAKVGTIVYAWVALGVNAGTVASTGWTSVLNADEGTSARYALLWRRKAIGDTTFSFTWTTSTKGVIGWTSYFGVDPTTPHENATLTTNGSTSRTAVPTSSQTPTAATRTALTCYGVRTTTSGNKPITWTADAALVERLDVDNNAAAATPWMGIQMADSNGPVTQAAHSYTATHNVAESHDGTAILFLIPAANEGFTVRIKTNGDNNTTAFWSRVRGAGAPDVAVNAHIDSNGNTANPGLNTGTLATNTEAIFVASTNTDFVTTTPTGDTWGGSYTRLGSAAIGSGATGAWGTHAWNTPVGTAAETPGVTWTNSMRNRYIFAITFTQASGGASTLASGNIASGEQFGAGVATPGAAPATSGNVASAEQFGANQLVPVIVSGNVSSQERFGAGQLVPLISSGGIPSSEQFGAGVLSPGPVTVTSGNIQTGERFGAGVISSGASTVTSGNVASGEQFGAGVISAGPVTLSSGGIQTGEKFGAGTLSSGGSNATSGNIASAEQFGAGVITGSAGSVTSGGVASGEQFGSSTITGGPVSLSGGGIASAERFGAGTLSSGGSGLTSGGVPSSEQFGAGVLNTGTVTAPLFGIPSQETFGAGSISYAVPGLLSSGGVGSTEQFGAGRITTPSTLTASSGGIASGERMGAGQIFAGTRPANHEIRMDRKVLIVSMDRHVDRIRMDRRTIEVEME